MATPVIDVSFTADVQCGSSPLTVQFTDTTEITNGFVRIRLWNFGDGSISEDQNPSHIYDGDPGETFDVTLTVLATETEFGSISSVTQFTTRVSNSRLVGSSTVSNEEAFLARANDPSDDDRLYHYTAYNGSQYFYFTNDAVLTLKAAFPYLAFVQLQMQLDAVITSVTGTVEAEGISTVPVSVGSWETHSRLAGITNETPFDSLIKVIPQVRIANVGQQTIGIKVRMRTKSYSNTSTQVFDDLEKPSFISLATLPVADFTAIPTAGPNPLSVKFANATVQSNCGPAATYSWKKRKTGSGDAFVEFSTQEHPTEIFTK